MNTDNNNRKIDFPLIQSIVLYIIVGIYLFPHFKYNVNPDGMSYMGIALKYSTFQFSDAINGYWGPLISWMMAPLLFLGMGQVIAANITLLIVGLLVLYQIRSIFKILEINLLLTYVCMNLFVLIVLFFVYSVITPDILFVLFALLFTNKIIDPGFRYKKYAGIVLGLIGAGLYFSKNFGLPYFMASFLIIFIIFYLQESDAGKRRKIMKNSFQTLIVFLVISGIWIFLISSKYGYFTVGTAGNYNRSLMGVKSMDPPMFYMGLLDPPNSSAINVWEDVSFLKLESWSIFDSLHTMAVEAKLFLYNLTWIVKFLVEFSILSIPFLAAIVVYLISRGKKMLSDPLFYLALTTFILFAGYAMIRTDSRYFWYGYVVIIICGARLINLLFNRKKINNVFKIIIILIFTSGFVYFPYKILSISFDSFNSIFQQSQAIKNLNVKGKIASAVDWEITYYLCFYNGWQYYGRSGNFDEKYLEQELKDKAIDYYFVWDGFDKNMHFFEKYPEISNGSIQGMKIYKLK